MDALFASNHEQPQETVARRVHDSRRLRKPESTEGRPWGQSLKKPSGAPLNLG